VSAPDPGEQTTESALADPPTAENLRELNVFCDPRFAASVMAGFRDAGDVVGAAWFRHVVAALRENAVEVIELLRAGDGAGAVRAIRPVPGRGIFGGATAAARNADGTWTMTGPDGHAHTIDPDKEASALMSPADYEALENEKWDAAARSRLGTASSARAAPPSMRMH
jgi:hypothetical protein